MEKPKTTEKSNKTSKIEKKTKMTVDVLDLSGKVVETIELSKEIFGVEPNKDLISQAVRVYLANQRLGLADTKTRGEIRGGGKKPWKQKGTGRARIGSTRAPHWRGGGVVHGPNLRDFTLKMPKKMKKAALISALSSKFLEKDLLVLSKLKFTHPKTKEGNKMLKDLNIVSKSIIVDKSFDQNEKRALNNLEKAKMTRVSDLNVYELMSFKKILLTKDAIKDLEESFSKKEKV